MQPEQPDTPTNEHETPTVNPLPVANPVVAKPVRAAMRKRDPALVAREVARTKRFVRVVLFAIAAALAGVFVAAFWIHPYDEAGQPRTMSTHTQLGMPPCNFVTLTGKPCPSCGMTTSFALLVRGDVLSSLRANWVGSFICIMWASTLVWAVVSSVWGRMLLIPPGRGELVLTLIVGVIVVLMLARWAAILLL